MANSSTLTTTKFKMIRPGLVMNGLNKPLDPRVKKAIGRLEDILKEGVYPKAAAIAEIRSHESKPAAGAAAAKKKDNPVPAIWKVDLSNEKAFEKAIDLLVETQETGEIKSTLSDIIDSQELTTLFEEVTVKLGESNDLDYNTSRILSNKTLLQYLFLRAVMRFRNQNATAIYNYITTEGVKCLYKYLLVKSTLLLKNAHKLETGSDTSFLNNIRPALRVLKASFDEDSFEKSVLPIIKDHVFNREEYNIVQAHREDLDIKESEMSKLVSYIKKSKVKYDDDNAKVLLNLALDEVRKGTYIDAGSETDTSDFEVTYYEDEKSSLEIDRQNLMCAAQLYYVMIYGEDLGIFDVVNVLLSKDLNTPLANLRKRETLANIDLYMFNDRFRDKKGIERKRTHISERAMFYRQVFGIGDSETVEGTVLNNDFNMLWEMLMVECVRYIEKMEKSENPNLFVSRQNIYQAIEDLQYNLSRHGAGMTKVITPIISKELDFVIEKFLKEQEILTFKRCTSFIDLVRQVRTEQTGQMPNVTALRNKATFGHKILSAIANYTPAHLQDDETFSGFLSTVEAFIIANGQLQEQDLPAGEENEENLEAEHAGYGSSGNNEWNF